MKQPTLIERLRRFPRFALNGGTWVNIGGTEPVCEEAAVEIERLMFALKACAADKEHCTGLAQAAINNAIVGFGQGGYGE